MSESAIAVRPEQHGQVASLESFALGAENILARKHMLKSVMDKIMKPKEHYDVIAGANKPSLLKPGAEAISSTFQLCPRYVVTRSDMPSGHREYEITCELYNPAGGFVGSGVGSATTMEGKYRFRRSGHKCPECGRQETIIKGKQQYGGGWVCFKNKGGCGAKFQDGDSRIENQDIGRVEHDNPADYYNTVLKMGKKRAFVDAVLSATGASDIFTQDLEDLAENHAPAPYPGPPPQQAAPRNGGQSTGPAPQAPPPDLRAIEAELAAINDAAGLRAHWEQHKGAYAALTTQQLQPVNALYVARGQALAALAQPQQQPQQQAEPQAPMQHQGQQPDVAGFVDDQRQWEQEHAQAAQDAEPMITPDQLTYLQTHYSKRPRQARLDEVGQFVGRTLGSFKDLTKNEAHDLIDVFENEKAEAARG